MQLIKPVSIVLRQLSELLSDLTDYSYNLPVDELSGSTIGQHLRHIVEFYTELLNGYETGLVNYDQRRRDKQIETNRHLAIQQLHNIGSVLIKVDKPLLLVAAFPANEVSPILFETNYYRELLYNLEHTVHHMALIRIGIETISQVELPAQFGVAETTLEFRKACAQ